MQKSAYSTHKMWDPSSIPLVMLLLSLLGADSTKHARLPLYNHFTNTYLLRIHSAAEGGMQDLMLSLYGATMLSDYA